MWNPRENNKEKLVVVAIDDGKRSKIALKWAVDHVLTRGQTVRLVHVHTPVATPPVGNNDGTTGQEPHYPTMFLPCRCICSRKQVRSEAVTLEEQDIAKALLDYICFNRVDTLVLGAPSRNGIARLFKADIPSTVLKGAPHFCSVYIISKGKIASMRAASHPLPSIGRATENRLQDELQNGLQDELSFLENEISNLSSGRLSTDSNFFAFYDNWGSEPTRPSPKRSFSVESLDLLASGSGSGFKFANLDPPDEILSLSPTTNKETRPTTSSSPLNNEEMEEKMRMLELQMKQTMDMYHAACRDALTAKQKAMELQILRVEDEKRIEETMREKAEALLAAEEERENCKVAIKVAEAAHRRAEREAQRSAKAEFKALKEAEDKKMMLNSLGQSHAVLKYQSLFHILVVIFMFHLYFSKLNLN